MRQFLIRFSLLLIALYPMALPASLSASESAQTQEIVVDIPPVAMALERIKAENPEADFNVTILLPQNADAHHFALKPSQAKALETADYIFGIGTNFMPEFVKATQNLAPQNAQQAFYFDDYIQANNSQAPIRENDPHYWLSPAHMEQMTQFLAKNLGLNPPKTPIKSPNSDTQISALITSHDAFGYFEDATGYQSQGALQDAQGQSIAPRQMAQIEEQIKAEQIFCLLMESGEHDHSIEDFAQNENLRIEEFDLLGWQSLNAPNALEEYYARLAEIYKSCAH